MATALPDLLGQRLSIVFCSPVLGECAAERGHHHSGRGDVFWDLLHQAGLTPRRLSPEDDVTLPALGLGLTSLAARGDVPALAERVQRHGPAWVAFTGRRPADMVAAVLGQSRPALGPQDWTLGGSEVFVLPSSSSANQRRDYGGRPSRLEWWGELAQLAAVPSR